MGDCYAKLTSEQQKVLKAIRHDRLDVLALYRRKGMDFCFNDNNPLREAVLSNKIGILKFLHEECGVNLNSESGFAIRWAARKDHVDMVEWLCSLDCIDVTACGGEALNWARQNYHFSVEEILEAKIKQYERVNGIAFGSTLKQAHQNRRPRDIPCEDQMGNRSVLTTEFELAREQASAQREQYPRLRDPSFSVPKDKQMGDSFYHPSFENESFGLSPEFSSSAQIFLKSQESLNRSRLITKVRKADMEIVKDIFAKPIGSRSIPESQCNIEAGRAKTSAQALPQVTPRTRFKNHCRHAAEKLGTIPCYPPTEHRMKIQRMRRKQVVAKRSNHKSNVTEDNHRSSRDKRRIKKKHYQCTSIAKKPKIRSRSDEQIGFIGMRDELCEQGRMSKDIRKDLNNEEVQQMMHMGVSAKALMRRGKR